MDDRLEIAWRDYALVVDLYKHYFDMAVKINVFYYAVTGAIVSYYFAHPVDHLARFSLVLPVLMSAVLCFIFLRGAVFVSYWEEAIVSFKRTLQLQGAPDFRIFRLMLYCFSVVLAVVAIGLLYVIVAPLSPYSVPKLKVRKWAT